MKISNDRTESGVIIKTADLTDPDDCEAICSLINLYMQDSMGGNLRPHSEARQKRLVCRLKTIPHCHIFIAVSESVPAGLAVCFEMFSTFAVKPLINIHDLIVHPSFRRRGVGKAIMEGIESFAKRSGCSKLTLEVRGDNYKAQNLYRKQGYDECDPPMLFWSKEIC
ncbi:MAG: GNAT family N-acetyltransferase [Chitinispirillaceae bacterium]